MPFAKYASAVVVQPHVSRAAWAKIRTAGRIAKQTKLPENLVDRAASMFGGPFDIQNYLLTHATIIASVDTYAPSGIKLGSVTEDGFRINRKYADFRIKPETDKYINNNYDAWDRQVILAAYPTFIGGHNFVEHVQLEELSRGRIIDAVARDIGDSIYVDILIATDRKHTDLVRDIESGEMGELSMGCSVDGTLCTKCGHWAADETEMCADVKYAKGNTFFDKQGGRHRIAELCGHPSLGPHGGVQFIEASWVGNGAFKGAVARNILQLPPDLAKKAQLILASIPPQWDENALQKAASSQGVRVLRTFAPVRSKILVTGDVLDALAGWAPDGEKGGDEIPAPAAPKVPASPLQEIEEELTKHLVDRVKQRVQDQMRGPLVDIPADASMAPNDSIVKEGSEVRRAYVAGVRTLLKVASSDAAFLNGLATLDQEMGIQIPVQLYRAALARPKNVHAAGRLALGREPSLQEVGTLRRLSLLVSRMDRGTKQAQADARVAKVAKGVEK